MKKFTHKIMSLLLAMVLVFSLAACASKTDTKSDAESATSDTDTASTDAAAENTSSDVQEADANDDTTDSESEGLRFGFMTSNPTLQFFVDIADNFESSLKEGDSVVSYNFDDDFEKQASIVSDLIAQKVDMIILNCVDADAVKGPLMEADAAGIPVIVYESKTNNPELVKTMVLSDDYACGYEAGQALAEAMEGKGKVASFCWERSELGQTRLQGLKDAIAEYPDMELVANYDDDTDLDTCLQVVENMLQVHPDVTGFYSFTENGGLAAVSVFQAAGRDDIAIATVDSGDSTLQYIAEGKIYAGIDQQAWLMGENIAECAYKYFNGEELETVLYSPVKVITKENVSDYGYTVAE